MGYLGIGRLTTEPYTSYHHADTRSPLSSVSVKKALASMTFI